MILRRIIAHFKKQEWTAIALDFLIVVVGVFIGIQVSNWNAARTAERSEAFLLVTLESDFVDLKETLTGYTDRYLTLENQVSELIDMVRARTPPSDDAAVRRRLNAAWSAPRLPSPPASYADIIASGKLSGLSDPALRHALSRYGQEVALYEDLYPAVLNAATRRDSAIVRSIKVNNDLEVLKNGADFDGIAGYDWDVLKTAETDLQLALGWLIHGEQSARQQLEQVDKILAILKERPSP